MNSVIRLRGSYARRPRPRWSVKRLIQRLHAAWLRMVGTIVSQFPPDSPQPSPPLAKSAALREGALLSEYVDARSNKNVA